LASWRLRAQAGREASQLEGPASSHAALKRLGRGLRALEAWAGEALGRRAAVERHYRARRLGFGLGAWRDSALRRRQAHLEEWRASVRFDFRSKCKALRQWRSRTESSRRLADCAAELVAKITPQLPRCGFAAKAFRVWRGAVRDQRASWEEKAVGAARERTRLLRVSFEALLEHVSSAVRAAFMLRSWARWALTRRQTREASVASKKQPRGANNSSLERRPPRAWLELWALAERHHRRRLLRAVVLAWSAWPVLLEWRARKLLLRHRCRPVLWRWVRFAFLPRVREQRLLRLLVENTRRKPLTTMCGPARAPRAASRLDGVYGGKPQPGLHSGFPSGPAALGILEGGPPRPRRGAPPMPAPHPASGLRAGLRGPHAESSDGRTGARGSSVGSSRGKPPEQTRLSYSELHSATAEIKALRERSHWR